MFAIFYFSKVLLQLFYFRISLYIFLIFLFQIFDTNACLQKFLHMYFCVLFSLPQIFISILFVQNVFQEILFPNFYSNFLFSIFGVRNIFGQKILIQTFAILFVSSNFSFSQSFVCLIFSLNFWSATNFDSYFLYKIYSESFWTKN